MAASNKAVRLKQLITGGLFSGGNEKFGAAVLDHTKEEELLGLPPPTVSALGSPEVSGAACGVPSEARLER